MARLRGGRFCVGLGVVAGLLASTPVPAMGNGDAATVADLDRAASERAHLGLPAGSELVGALIRSGLDVGSAAVGIVLTADELAALDLPGRGIIADRAEKELLPALRGLDGYAGMYQDQTRGGRLIVLFTRLADDAATALRIRARDLPLDVHTGARSTMVELEAAQAAAWEAWRAASNTQLLQVGIDEVNNRLLLGVAGRDLASARSADVGLNVDSLVVEADDATEQFCDTSLPDARISCYDPMKAGTFMSPSPGCTQGFHVVKAITGVVRYTFATSGHCAGNFYMQGYPYGPSGFVGGTVTGTNLYSPGGQDFVLIHIGKGITQASAAVYDTSAKVTSSGNPITNEMICASPGKTDNLWNTGNDCGWVQIGTIQYAGECLPSPCFLNGANHDGISTDSGDSGSPIFRVTSSTSLTAVGIHATAGGFFAKMASSLSAAGASIYHE